MGYGDWTTILSPKQVLSGLSWVTFTRQCREACRVAARAIFISLNALVFHLYVGMMIHTHRTAVLQDNVFKVLWDKRLKDPLILLDVMGSWFKIWLYSENINVSLLNRSGVMCASTDTSVQSTFYSSYLWKALTVPACWFSHTPKDVQNHTDGLILASPTLGLHW